ncbi:hypothetical protein [Bacillus toyonensis]|uniref:hypothetical protein n=1 Tax=Bacillus toyonensis TaxID=155322 RepID=UPI001146048A|nr:hypothetical protein [Bacillus toyonensis]
MEKVFSTACFCVNTDKKEEKERFLMMGAKKNHRDERVSVSVEELVPQDHFLRAIEVEVQRLKKFSLLLKTLHQNRL